MINKKKCIAMLLAGGQGARLGVLTKTRAKPAVPYGGKYKIIDFPLSNCTNSGFDTVGVLTQYQPLELNSYISTGAPWDLDSNTGGVYILPPYLKAERGEWYSGTANAIYQNSFFIDKFDPDYLLVLSGDHIYKMDYNAMLKFHIQTEASATIAVIEVPIEDASRFGIMNTDETFRVVEFEEKPERPKNNLASMGVYIFNWRNVKAYLRADHGDRDSTNDFGRDIIPKMLAADEMIFAYRFKGYWKDVGTIESLWEANMELLQDRPALNLHDPTWKILSRNPNQPPHYVGGDAQIRTSFVSEGCRIYGTVENSVLFPEVTIAAGAHVRDSIIMQNTVVGEDCEIIRAIIDEDVTVGSGCHIGGDEKITVIGQGASLNAGMTVEPGASIQPDCQFINDACETGNEVSL
jgi:glucose-1-phosphate adenylyltransferase